MSQFMLVIHRTESSTASEINCTYVIRDATEGLSHVRNLLSMLVDISMAAATSYDVTPAFQDYMGWLLDSFLVTQELHKKWRANSLLHPSCSDACAMPLYSIQALLSALPESLSPSLLRKGYAMLSIFCTDLLEDPTQLSQSSIQLNFCSSIMKLAAICRRYDSVRRAVSLHLIPIIHASLTSVNSIISGMGNDLKVDQLLPFVAKSLLITSDSMHSSLSGVRSRGSQRSQS
jgi:serine/threonine-protein kinase ATR